MVKRYAAVHRDYIPEAIALVAHLAAVLPYPQSIGSPEGLEAPPSV